MLEVEEVEIELVVEAILDDNDDEELDDVHMLRDVEIDEMLHIIEVDDEVEDEVDEIEIQVMINGKS